jgi:hypothetical protein
MPVSDISKCSSASGLAAAAALPAEFFHFRIAAIHIGCNCQNHPPRSGKFNGVAQQVEQYLPQPVGVPTIEFGTSSSIQ